MPKQSRRTIVFIMGHARSGSTILNIMLGTAPKSIAAGETGNFYRSGLINNEYCSCGANFSDCEFWSSINNIMRDRLQDRAAVFVSYSKALENWRNFLYPPRLKKKNLDVQDYLATNALLYEAIFAASGKRTLIDASKDPMRFHYLHTIDTYDFKIIHIVRDPRAVCWSQLRTFKKDLASGLERDMQGRSILTTIKSLYVNAYLAERMKATSNVPYVVINYDDMARDAIPILQEIDKKLMLDTTSIQALISNGETLNQFHNAAGNRLRMSKDIKLQHDISWKPSLSRWQSTLITVLTLPLLIRYRFRVFP